MTLLRLIKSETISQEELEEYVAWRKYCASQLTQYEHQIETLPNHISLEEGE